jgi:hypothetical protein
MLPGYSSLAQRNASIYRGGRSAMFGGMAAGVMGIMFGVQAQSNGDQAVAGVVLHLGHLEPADGLGAACQSPDDVMQQEESW